MRLRKGFRVALEDVFADARDMQGSLDPDEIEASQAAVDALRKETFALLRGLPERGQIIAFPTRPTRRLFAALDKWMAAGIEADDSDDHMCSPEETELRMAWHAARPELEKDDA